MRDLKNRPFWIVGMVVGLAIFALAYRGEITRKETTKLRDRVVRVEETSPCTNLTTSECALKLLRALPEVERHRIRLRESTLRALEQRARRERQTLRRLGTGESNVPGSSPAGGGSPGRTPGGTSPPSGDTRPGASPAPAPSPTPSPPTAPAPQPPAIPSPTPSDQSLVQTPEVQTPSIGPVPSITVPPIMVPCIDIRPIIQCEKEGK